MDESHTRRGLLRAAGVAGLAATAGCGRLRKIPGVGGLDETPTAEFRRNKRRTGYVPDETVPTDVERYWRVVGINVGDHTAAKSSPVPDGHGNLVVAGDTGEIHSITPGGRINWVASTNPSSYGIHATPTIANDTVYVGAYDGSLYAFDREDGNRKWRTHLGDALGGSPAYVDGSIYTTVEYTDPSGSLFRVDAANGNVTFEDDRMTDQPHSTPGIDPDVGTLSAGANDGYLYTWHWPEMEFAWKFDAGGDVKSPVAVHDGSAFFGSWDNAVFRVDLTTGELDWRFETGGPVMTAPGIDTDEGVVYVGSHDTYVYALDVETGEVVWDTPTAGMIVGSVTVASDHVLVGSFDGNLYALDKDDGSVVWSVGSFGHVTSEPLIYDGAIYYTERATSERTGGLYRLNPAE